LVRWHYKSVEQIAGLLGIVLGSGPTNRGKSVEQIAGLVEIVLGSGPTNLWEIKQIQAKFWCDVKSV
jgi:hypothetical protein